MPEGETIAPPVDVHITHHILGRPEGGNIRMVDGSYNLQGRHAYPR